MLLVIFFECTRSAKCVTLQFLQTLALTMLYVVVKMRQNVIVIIVVFHVLTFFGLIFVVSTIADDCLERLLYNV